MRPRVLGFHDESVNHGGTTRYLRSIIAGLDRDRFKPVLFATVPRDWHRDLAAQGVTIVTLAEMPGVTPDAAPRSPTSAGSAPSRHPVRSMLRAFPAVAWTLGQLRELRALQRLFTKQPVDLLHTNQAGLETASMAARLARVPVVIGTWHVDPSYDLEGMRIGWRYRTLESFSMRAFHHSISVSDDTRRQWMERCRLGSRYAERVTVIHNGIDTSPFRGEWSRSAARHRQGIPAGDVVLGSLGRLEPAKGYAYLLDALAILRQETEAFTFLLAGRGPHEEELRSRAQALGLARHVRFLGFVADVRQLLEPLDLYVQPSLCESLGLGILEAGASGLPVVASRIGGIPETVVDGTTGILVPPRDPIPLAEALKRLMSAPELRSEMGARAQERVCQHFTSEEMVRKTVALYDRLLSTAHRSDG